MNPSDGYKLLVLLAREKIISSIITTNFDNLLERTQDILKMDVFQTHAPGISIPAEYYLRSRSHKPIYMKMHGDIDGRLVTHLSQHEINTKEYEAEFRHLFSYIVKQSTIIFCGYSGFDNMLTKLFMECLSSINNIYWCNIVPPDPASELVMYLQKNTNFNYIQIKFEELFRHIATHLLKERMLFNADSVFIYSLIQAKTEKLQMMFFRRLEYSQKEDRQANLIQRTIPDEIIRSFIFDSRGLHKNLFVLSGQSGVGKTNLVAQFCDTYASDINILPICIDNVSSCS